MVSVFWLPAPSVARTVIVFAPAESGTDAVQDVVPVADVKAPPLFDHSTKVNVPGAASDAVPASARGVAPAVKFAPPLVVMVTPGGVLSRVTTIVSIAVLPAVSVACTSIVWAPALSAMPVIVHEAVPVTPVDPYAPPSIRHRIDATDTLSEDVPPR